MDDGYCIECHVDVISKSRVLVGDDNCNLSVIFGVVSLLCCTHSLAWCFCSGFFIVLLFLFLFIYDIMNKVVEFGFYFTNILKSEISLYTVYKLLAEEAAFVHRLYIDVS